MGERATEKYKRDQYRSAWVCLNKAKAHNKQWQGRERSSPTHSCAQKRLMERIGRRRDPRNKGDSRRRSDASIKIIKTKCVDEGTA
jgi:hypothetical protein